MFVDAIVLKRSANEIAREKKIPHGPKYLVESMFPRGFQ
jgi:hypothetical protein